MILSRYERFLLLLPLFLVLAPFLLWPAISGLFYSFTDFAPGQSVVHWVGLENYAALAGDLAYRSSWQNIVIFVLVSVPLELLTGFVLAYLLRKPFRGRGFLRVLLLVPWLVSPIANGVMWHYLFNLQFGMLNYIRSWLRLSNFPSPLGLSQLALPTTIAVSIWHEAPFACFLLLPGLIGIPDADWEYATLEGASTFQRIRYIAFPLLRPLILVVGLLLTGEALGTFDSILILTGGGPGIATMTPGLYSYQQAFQNYNWPAGATSAWLIALAILLVGLVYLRLMRSERSQ